MPLILSHASALAVLREKCVERHAQAVAERSDSDGLHHAGVAELRDHQARLELTRRLDLVGLDAPDKVRVRLFQLDHQLVQRVLRESGNQTDQGENAQGS